MPTAGKGGMCIYIYHGTQWHPGAVGRSPTRGEGAYPRLPAGATVTATGSASHGAWPAGVLLVVVPLTHPAVPNTGPGAARALPGLLARLSDHART